MTLRTLALVMAIAGLTSACMGDRVSDAQLKANEAKAKADAADSQVSDADIADALGDALIDAVEDDIADATTDTDTTPPPCKSPSDCPDPLDLCIAGVCQPQVACKSDKQCADQGHVCDQAKGVCVACLIDGDCDDGESCKAQTCVPPAETCAATKDCPSGQVCDKTASLCVSCIDGNDCEVGQFCTETVCKPDACTANETGCVDAAIRKVCAANGSAWTESKCTDGLTCIDGECAKTICTPGAKQCADGENGIVTCNLNGTAWGVAAPCPTDATCKGAICVPHVCEPNAKKCDAQGGLLSCAPDGLSEMTWFCPATQDGKGQTCVTEAGAAVCKAQACVPGTSFCDNAKAMTCAANGLSSSLKADCGLPGTNGKAQLCLDGGCVPAACKKDDKVCADFTTLATCNAAGNGYDKTPCGDGKACENAVCVALVCAPGQAMCDGQKAVKCNTSGTASAVVEDCGGKGKVCVNGGCAAKVCAAGQVQCQGAAVGTCKADLTGWDLKPCGTGEVCAGGKCTAKVCEPGAIECLDKTIRACNGNGTAWVTVQDCAKTGQGCLGGECVATTCAAGSVTCAGDKVATCKADGSGYAEASCDDGNACTADACALSGGVGKCESVAVADAACSDGDGCTANDSCNAAGACVAGPAKTCGANATCAKADGACSCDIGFVGDGQTCKCGPQMVAVDVDGKTVCAPDYPAWGIRPESPPAEWFKDNGDGTVSDSQSGLVWQKADSGTPYFWQGAKSYCQSLEVGARTDWRAPTLFELQTLVDFHAAAPVVPSVFSGTSAPTLYWSASPYKGPNAEKGPYAWYAHFGVGYSNVDDTAGVHPIRCVASPTAAGVPSTRFKVDAAKGVVHDLVTELTWQRDGTSSGKTTWQAASTYCQTLNLNGMVWRLPTVVELSSIVDLDQATQGTDPDAFPATPTALFWSSTTAKGKPTQAWAVVFTNGASGEYQFDGEWGARCVRANVPCGADSKCDDGNACTVDKCQNGVCASSPAPDGTNCANNMVCKASLCIPKAPSGMAFIPGGTFWRGCNPTKDKLCKSFANESPQVKATVDSFFMDLTEVTQAAYAMCKADGACTAPTQGGNTYCSWDSATGKFKPGSDLRPVNCVTRTQAAAFCKWRGVGLGLPSEDQWEYAARGSCELNGSTASGPCDKAMRTYPWGETPATCSQCVLYEGAGSCGETGAAAVGSKLTGDSPYGIHDMAGNLAEWTTGTLNSSGILKGGGWTDGANTVRSSFRLPQSVDSAGGASGFRCAKSYP